MTELLILTSSSYITQDKLQENMLKAGALIRAHKSFNISIERWQHFGDQVC
jgi:hypothetical protein